MKITNDCEIKFKVVLLLKSVRVPSWHNFCSYGEVKYDGWVTRSLQTWVCVSFPLSTRWPRTHYVNTLDLNFWKLKVGLMMAMCEWGVCESQWEKTHRALCSVRWVEGLSTCQLLLALCMGCYYFVLVTPDFSEGTGQSLEIVQRRACIKTSLHVLVTFCLFEYGLSQSNHLWCAQPSLISKSCHKYMRTWMYL